MVELHVSSTEETYSSCRSQPLFVQMAFDVSSHKHFIYINTSDFKGSHSGNQSKISFSWSGKFIGRQCILNMHKYITFCIHVLFSQCCVELGLSNFTVTFTFFLRTIYENNEYWQIKIKKKSVCGRYKIWKYPPFAQIDGEAKFSVPNVDIRRFMSTTEGSQVTVS